MMTVLVQPLTGVLPEPAHGSGARAENGQLPFTVTELQLLWKGTETES